MYDQRTPGIPVAGVLAGFPSPADLFCDQGGCVRRNALLFLDEGHGEMLQPGALDAVFVCSPAGHDRPLAPGLRAQGETGRRETHGLDETC